MILSGFGGVDNDQLLVLLRRKGAEPVRQRGRRQNLRHDEHVGPRETTFYMRFTIRSDKHNKGSHKLSTEWYTRAVPALA